MDAAVGEAKRDYLIFVSACACIESPFLAGQRIGAPHIAETTMPEGRKITHCHGFGRLVINGHGGLAAADIRRIHRDDGHTHAGQRVGFLIGGGKSGYDEGVGVTIGWQPSKEFRTLLDAAGSVYGQVIACAAQFVIQPVE